ncbi:MAG: hypothetical protein DRM99_05430 [Thermoplasmata archaeon]|nr:MAG: hypothetical protein DRM99_05430 [Thermoplasmata archaeon]
MAEYDSERIEKLWANREQTEVIFRDPTEDNKNYRVNLNGMSIYEMIDDQTRDKIIEEENFAQFGLTTKFPVYMTTYDDTGYIVFPSLAKLIGLTDERAWDTMSYLVDSCKALSLRDYSTKEKPTLQEMILEKINKMGKDAIIQSHHVAYFAKPYSDRKENHYINDILDKTRTVKTFSIKRQDLEFTNTLESEFKRAFAYEPHKESAIMSMFELGDIMTKIKFNSDSIKYGLNASIFGSYTDLYKPPYFKNLTEDEQRKFRRETAKRLAYIKLIASVVGKCVGVEDHVFGFYGPENETFISEKMLFGEVILRLKNRDNGLKSLQKDFENFTGEDEI